MTRHPQLIDEARERLDQSGYPCLSQLQCKATDGVLVLEGSVPTYYLKQLAQTLVRKIKGVKIIANNVQVEGT